MSRSVHSGNWHTVEHTAGTRKEGRMVAEKRQKINKCIKFEVCSEQNSQWVVQEQAGALIRNFRIM